MSSYIFTYCPYGTAPMNIFVWLSNSDLNLPHLTTQSSFRKWLVCLVYWGDQWATACSTVRATTKDLATTTCIRKPYHSISAGWMSPSTASISRLFVHSYFSNGPRWWSHAWLLGDLSNNCRASTVIRSAAICCSVSVSVSVTSSQRISQVRSHQSVQPKEMWSQTGLVLGGHCRQ